MRGPSPPWRITALLVALGAVAGVAVSVPLAYLGKVIAQAPAPATVANYVWNMWAFGAMGAAFLPVLTWSAMRRVPLWRAIAEPAVGGLVGALAGMALGSSVAFLGLAAAGISGAIWRLTRMYRDRGALPAGAEQRLL